MRYIYLRKGLKPLCYSLKWVHITLITSEVCVLNSLSLCHIHLTRGGIGQSAIVLTPTSGEVWDNHAGESLQGIRVQETEHEMRHTQGMKTNWSFKLECWKQQRTQLAILLKFILVCLVVCGLLDRSLS